MTTQAPALHHRHDVPGATHTSISQPDSRMAGVIVLLGTIVSTATVAMDQGPAGKDPLTILQGMVKILAWHKEVHVIAMACICALIYGGVVLSRRLGLQRGPVLFGLITYVLGSTLMFIGTIIDGFVSTGIAAAFVNGSPEAVKAGYWMIQAAENVVLTDMAQVAWVLQSVAAVSWGVALLRDRGIRRNIGVVGLVAGALPGIAVIAAGSNMDLTVVIATLLLQAVWNIAVGILLLRDKPLATV